MLQILLTHPPLTSMWQYTTYYQLSEDHPRRIMSSMDVCPHSLPFHSPNSYTKHYEHHSEEQLWCRNCEFEPYAPCSYNSDLNDKRFSQFAKECQIKKRYLDMANLDNNGDLLVANILVTVFTLNKGVGVLCRQLIMQMFSHCSYWFNMGNRPCHLIFTPFCTSGQRQSMLSDRLTSESTMACFQAPYENQMLIGHFLCIHRDCSRQVSAKYL